MIKAITFVLLAGAGIVGLRAYWRRAPQWSTRLEGGAWLASGLAVVAILLLVPTSTDTSTAPTATSPGELVVYVLLNVAGLAFLGALFARRKEAIELARRDEAAGRTPMPWLWPPAVVVAVTVVLSVGGLFLAFQLLQKYEDVAVTPIRRALGGAGADPAAREALMVQEQLLVAGILGAVMFGFVLPVVAGFVQRGRVRKARARVARSLHLEAGVGDRATAAGHHQA